MIEPMLELESAVLKVSNVERTADYYREVLGFSIDWMFGEPPTQAGCSARLVFSRTHSVLCFRTNNLDILHDNYQSSGAHILAPPALNEDSGQREMDVEDCDGHILRFVQTVEPEEQTLEIGEECPCKGDADSHSSHEDGHDGHG